MGFAAHVIPGFIDKNLIIKSDDGEVRDITPDYAQKLLDYDPNSVNKQDRRSINKYEELMKNGEWMENGAAIMLARSGVIIDGTQRLWACVRSKLTMKNVPIISNVPADTVHVVDQHARRNFTSVLQARGYENSRVIVNTLSSLIRYDNGKFGYDEERVTWQRYSAVLEHNPEILEGIKLAAKYKKSCIKNSAANMLAVMSIKAGHVAEYESMMFMTTSENNLKSMSHPAAVLFTGLSGMNGSLLVKHEHLALSIMALNDIVDGVNEISKRYKFSPKIGSKTYQPGNWPTISVIRAEWGNKTNNVGVPRLKGYEGLEKSSYKDILAKAEDFEKSSEDGTPDGKIYSDTIALFPMQITPEFARKMLAEHNTRNRDIVPSHRDMIARDILGGRWMNSSQPVHIDREGILLNGQHRLSACVQANQAIESWIVTGVHPGAFGTYDNQKRRALNLEGENLTKLEAQAVRSAARLYVRIERGGTAYGMDFEKPSSAELIHVVENNPGLIDAAQEYASIGIITHGVATFFGYYTYKQNPKLSKLFMKWLENSSYIPPGHYFAKRRDDIFKLRNDMNHKNGQRKAVLKLLTEMWDEFVEKEAPKVDDHTAIMDEVAEKIRLAEEKEAQEAAEKERLRLEKEEQKRKEAAELKKQKTKEARMERQRKAREAQKLLREMNAAEAQAVSRKTDETDQEDPEPADVEPAEVEPVTAEEKQPAAKKPAARKKTKRKAKPVQETLFQDDGA